MPSDISPIQFGCGAQAEPDHLLCPAEYRDAMRLVRETGYTTVEYPHLAHLSLDEAIEVKGHTREVGLEPWVTHSKVLVAESPHAHRQYRREQPICARNAEVLGVQVIVDHVGVDGAGEDVDRDVARLRESGRVAADHGLRLAVENILTLSAAYTRRVVDAIDEAHVGCCCDTGHALLTGAAPQDAIRLMGEKLFNTHLQDCFARRDDHLPPGIGIMDWEEITRALVEIGFRHPWMLEISGAKPHRESPDLRDLGLRRVMVIGLRFLQYHVDRMSAPGAGPPR